MKLVEVSKGRATVSSGAGALEIVIPSRKNIFVLVFLFAWLGGWYFGETSAIKSLFQPTAHDQWFLMFWLLGWSVGGVFVGFSWLWNLLGKEVLIVRSDVLIYQRALGPFKLTRSYDLAHVKDLRTTPSPSFMQRQNGFGALGVSGGQIAFDYGAKTINIGAGVDEAEAKGLVEMVKQHTGRNK
ncbi:MAG: hypothetical protein JWM78_1844 [Verrucomicrobiaceae bacterium]|nr:hypothetical protein [Verrucomicrobiaceae bacterium]